MHVQILGLSEIWHPDVTVKENLKKSWKWIATERRGERGGAASLISKEVKVFERKDLLSPNIEAVWSNLYSREENFSLGSVYIQPNDTKSLNELLKVISKVLEESLPLVLTGNFNAHHQFWYDRNANKLGTDLFEFLVDKNLIVMNNANPTRKDRIIDLTIVSTMISDKVSNCRVQQEVI